MTNEEAILHMILRREELKNSVGDLDEDIKAFDMAIRALEIIQTGLLKDCESCRAELPCTDAISRQEVLDAFGLSEKTRKYGGDHSGYNTMMLYEIQDVIEDLPSVSTETKNRCSDAISRQGEKNISKGFEDFMIKSLQRQAESENEE